MEAAGTHAGVSDAQKLQKALTAQLEQAKHAELERDILALPVRDERRVAFLNVDRYSTQWVAAWPSHAWSLAGPEFKEGVCRYLALPSPACAPYVGQLLGNGRRRQPLDAHGHTLTCTPLDKLWDVQHDTIAHKLFTDMDQLGVRVEWVPKRIFSHLIAPQQGRGGGVKNILPDLRVCMAPYRRT